MAEYDGATRRGDRYVGKLLAYLDELGLLDGAVVVLTSDHGEEFLDHGRCFHLRTLYREVLHVPLIVSAPGLFPGRVDALVPASASIGPTILDLVAIKDHRLPAKSVAGLAAGGVAEDYSVVSETSRRMQEGRGQGHLRSMTTASAHLIHWITQDRYEYFDLLRDPDEQSPITDGSRLAELAGELALWVEAHPRLGESIESSERDPWLEEQLRSLGYLE